MRESTAKLLVVMILSAAPLLWAEPLSSSAESPAGPVFGAQATVSLPAHRIPAPENPREYGTASWYSETDPFINKHTANGEVFDDSKLTCASWHFPFGTYLEVQNLSTGKSVVCRVNDRGPSKRLHRLIDLTKTAFGRIAELKRGLIKVSVRPVPRPKPEDVKFR